MNIKEIKEAVDAGKVVRCDRGGYTVIKDSGNTYQIKHEGSDYCIGLHGKPGTQHENRLNGTGFYIDEDEGAGEGCKN